MRKNRDSHFCMGIIVAAFILLSSAEVLVRSQWPVPLYLLLVCAQASVIVLGWYQRSTTETAVPLAFIQVLIAFLLIHSVPEAGGPLTMVLAQLVLPGTQALEGRIRTAVSTAIALVWVGTIDPAHNLWVPHLPSALVWAVFFAFPILLGSVIRLKADQQREQEESFRDDLQWRRLELARYLHRSVARELTFTVMKAQEINEGQGVPPALKDQLQDVEASTRHALMQTYKILDGLNSMKDTNTTGPLGYQPLGTTLQAVIADLEDLGFTVEAHMPQSCDVIPAEHVEPLITVLEEASGNIAKHADRSRPVTLELRTTNQETLFNIDNFVQEGSPALVQVGSSGIGMSHMRHAVESAGGNFCHRTIRLRMGSRSSAEGTEKGDTCTGAFSPLQRK